MCDCETGYILDYVIYSASAIDVDKDDPLGFSGSVVKVLMERYFGGNHVLYTDNYYTAPWLAKYLADHGIGTVGTVWSHRKDWPEFPEAASSTRGDVHLKKCGKMLAIRWHDKKIVNMLSTIHTGEMQYSGKTDFKTGEPI